MPWRPNLFPKQEAAYLSTARRILCSGPRFCGKTIAIEHRVWRHCWRHDNARVAVIPLTNRTGSLGIWPELTGPIYNQWKAAGVASDKADFGYDGARGFPRQDSITRVRFCRVRNRHGGASEVYLFPIESAEEAYEKLLSTQFSMIWISEAHLFEDRKIFDVAQGQLRGLVPYEHACIIADCNPPESGEDHWLHDVFFKERELRPEQYPDHWTQEMRDAFAAQQAGTEVFMFGVEENIFLDPRQKQQLVAMYASSPVEYARLVRGEWVKDQPASAIFKAAFSRTSHVVGNASAANEADWEMLLASNDDGVFRHNGRPLILCGWDTGDVNHAWAAWQVRAGAQPSFDLIDELVVLDSATPVEEFASRVMQRRAQIERDAGEPVSWLDYSDSSAKAFRAAVSRGVLPSSAEATDAAAIERVGKGSIRLRFVGDVKKGGWQQRRCNFIIRLLNEGRIRISAHCFNAIRMFENLRPSTARKAVSYIAEGQREKHIFDAMSYPLAMFAYTEITSGGGAAPRRIAI